MLKFAEYTMWQKAQQFLTQKSNYKATKLLVSVAFAERIERIRYLILNEVRFWSV